MEQHVVLDYSYPVA